MSNILEQLGGHHFKASFNYRFSEVTICIFENAHNNIIPPASVSFLFRLPDAENIIGGSVYSFNPYFNQLHERVCKHRRALNVTYHTAKGKILSRKGTKLGFEGGMLNVPNWS